ncbi:hypothetical protein I7M65_08385 [Neisseria meningitidis]|nr:hypothetical protein [Neisseria meningitidis]MBH6186898.1 hypothetical protein [Neisseria meningitidis]
MADISTVGEIVNFLAIATYNRPMTKIAEQAGLSDHAIEKAQQYNGDFFGFWGYCDSKNRAALVEWLAKQI